jgi:hypothetical protein
MTDNQKIRANQVYTETVTGRSVVMESKDQTHEWKYANDPNYRKVYDENHLTDASL